MGNVYIAEDINNIIRQVNFNSNMVVTLAGIGGASYANGPGYQAFFHSPISIYVDTAGSTIYVSEYFNYRIRQIICPSRKYFYILDNIILTTVF